MTKRYQFRSDATAITNRTHRTPYSVHRSPPSYGVNKNIRLTEIMCQPELFYNTGSCLLVGLGVRLLSTLNYNHRYTNLLGFSTLRKVVHLSLGNSRICAYICSDPPLFLINCSDMISDMYGNTTACLKRHSASGTCEWTYRVICTSSTQV